MVVGGDVPCPCGACGFDSVVVFDVPARYRAFTSGADVASICPRCLTVDSENPLEGTSKSKSDPDSSSDAGANSNPTPTSDPGSDSKSERTPDFTRLSDAFPTGDAAVPFALALGLCSSLATNREAIETLLEAVERAGVDPLLAIDRLLADPSVEPVIDLERRRHQLEQLLY